MMSKYSKGIQLLIYSYLSGIIVFISTNLGWLYSLSLPSDICAGEEVCFDGFFEKMFIMNIGWVISLILMFIVLKKLQITRKWLIFLLGMISLMPVGTFVEFIFYIFLPNQAEHIFSFPMGEISNNIHYVFIFPIVFGVYYLIFSKPLLAPKSNISNSIKRFHIKKKYIFFALPPLIVFAFYLFLFTPWDGVLINNLSKFNLTNVYANDKVGFTFKYPKNGSVYKSFDTEENSLNVFSEYNNQGSVCYIYVNDPNRNKAYKNDETISYNGLNWIKWKDIDHTGSIYDSHSVSWFTQKGNNHAMITSVIEREGYCDSIVSTFKFTK
jgi:hypothetical protein